MTRMYRVPPACSKKWKNLSRRLLQLLATVMMIMVVNWSYDDDRQRYLGQKFSTSCKLSK